MRQSADKRSVQNLCGDKSDDRNAHWRCDILPGVETGCEHFDQYQAQQADGIGYERLTGHKDILFSESAVMK